MITKSNVEYRLDQERSEITALFEIKDMGTASETTHGGPGPYNEIGLPPFNHLQHT